MLPPIRPILRDGLRAVAQKRNPGGSRREPFASSSSFRLASGKARAVRRAARTAASASAERAPAANDAGDPTADFSNASRSPMSPR